MVASGSQDSHEELARMLLQHGADPNATMNITGKPYRPAHSVLAENLQRGFKVGKKFHGYTPLMWAVKKKRAKIAQLLCEGGAKVDIV